MGGGAGKKFFRVGDVSASTVLCCWNGEVQGWACRGCGVWVQRVQWRGAASWGRGAAAASMLGLDGSRGDGSSELPEAMCVWSPSFGFWGSGWWGSGCVVLFLGSSMGVFLVGGPSICCPSLLLVPGVGLEYFAFWIMCRQFPPQRRSGPGITMVWPQESRCHGELSSAEYFAQGWIGVGL